MSSRQLEIHETTKKKSTGDTVNIQTRNRIKAKNNIYEICVVLIILMNENEDRTKQNEKEMYLRR